MHKSDVAFEVIVVDDGSTDKSKSVVKEYAPDAMLIEQQNQGKGAAVKTGVKASTGTFILVQDADLEYHPTDIPALLSLAQTRTAVYGSRMIVENASGRKSYRFPKDYSLSSRVASLVLSFLHILLYGRLITDTLTGYKIYHRDFYLQANVSTSGFETDHELTAKLLRRGYDIVEYPIQFTPRTVAEGKKINVNDFFKAIWVIFWFRIQ